MVVALTDRDAARAVDPALTRVVTYSDSFVVRGGLERVCHAPSLHWCAETVDHAELEGLVEREQPDLVLAAPGPAVARRAFPQLSALVPHCHVLVLLPASATHQIIAAEMHRRLGLFSLPMEATPEELLQTVQRLVTARGDRQHVRLDNALPSTERLLTPREGQVLRELAKGSANRAIAAKLTLSDDTVKTHLRNVYRKLGVRCRGEAIARYMGGA